MSTIRNRLWQQYQDAGAVCLGTASRGVKAQENRYNFPRFLPWNSRGERVPF